MDIGCANGLLLQSLVSWAGEVGFAIRPHGLDFVPELIELARGRFPRERDNFIVANAFYWSPIDNTILSGPIWNMGRARIGSSWFGVRYPCRRVGRRLIVCHYRNRDESYVALTPIVEAAGFSAAGGVDAPGVAIVWSDGPP